jgi:ketopantoate reductase
MSQKTIQRKLIIDGKEENFIIDVYSRINDSAKLVIVATKSLHIDDSLIDYLIQINKDILFIQNGMSTMMKLKNKSNKFEFGTIIGIEAKYESEICRISSKKPTLAIRQAISNSSISSLVERSRHPILNKIRICEDQHLFYRKYIRWVVVSILNIIEPKNLIEAQQLMGEQEIDNLIMDINKYVLIISGKKFSKSDILMDISNLPETLKTSSYEDYKKSKKSEIEIEIDLMIQGLASESITSTSLSKWKKLVTDGR